MSDLPEAFRTAFVLVVSLDERFVEVVGLSLRVSGTAVLIAALIGLPLGALLGVTRFPGRRAVVAVLNALMGLPAVVVGIFVYLLLSRAGPLGELGWLFTPKAMIVAQAVLVTPLVAALSRQVIEDLWVEYREQLMSLGATTAQTIPTLIWDGRHQLITTLLAGFGRAIAEVGSVMIVGGNIAHVTRVMTTAIALETSKGDLALALALGIVLLSISLIVNAAASFSQSTAG